MHQNIDENLLLTSSRFIEQRKYWIGKLAGDIEKTELIPVHQGGGQPSQEYQSLKFMLPDELTARLMAMGKNSDLSLYIILLTALKTLIYRYTSRQDTTVISPLFKQNTAGVPLNRWLFIRNFLDHDITLRELLFEIRTSILEAYGNQDYPYDRLIESLFNAGQIRRKEPISNIVCVLKNIHVDGDDETIAADGVTFLFDKGDDRLKGEIVGRHSGSGQYPLEAISQHFIKIVTHIAADITQKVGDISFLTDEEQRQLLRDFNGAGAECTPHTTIDAWLREQERETPHHIALVEADLFLTYGEMGERVGLLACRLRSRGLTGNAAAGLMAEPSIDMMIGALAILRANGAYMPINPEFPAQRITYMLQDSGVRLLLTSSTSTPLAGGLAFGGEVIPLDARHIDVDREGHGETGDTGRPDDVVYMIYTSGSTGSPKGVLIENRNLLNYVVWFHQAACLTPEDRTVLTASFAFDLGYTAIYPSLLKGARLHIVPPDIYGSGEDLFAYIQKQEISFLKMTPSHFSILTACSAFEQQQRLNLKLVVLGGEEIQLEDVEKAHQAYPRLRIMNHYGPTETTIGSVATDIDLQGFEEYRRIPVIGRPLANTRASILDRHLNLLPVGIAGELCLAGAGVARGYLNQPELTADKFVNVAAKSREDTRSSKDEILTPKSYILYKTGDLARFQLDGHIEFLGRRDHQVKIRGYRIEIGEIENKLASHPLIGEVVVVARAIQAREKCLCAYLTGTGRALPSASELREYLLTDLPDYMVPSYFVQLEQWPLTANGKLDRSALPDPQRGSGGDEYVGPRDRTEEKLVEIWSSILNLQPEQIGIFANFFGLGGHSLNATVMAARIHKLFEVKIPLSEIFKTPSIRAIGDYIKAAGRSEYCAVRPVEKREYYHLSSAQKRVFVLQQMDEIGVVYNIPVVTRLQGDLDKDHLEKVFRKIIDRHESLRTSFQIIDNQPVQRVHEGTDFNIEYVDFVEKDWMRPFDLSRAPLMRLGLVASGGGQYLLLMEMHHIIADEISMEIFIREFLAVYAGQELPPLRLQYKDFSLWQNEEKTGAAIKAQEAYWLEAFAGGIPVVDLPTDYPRPQVQDFEGHTLRFDVNESDTRALKDLALAEGTTLYMVMLTVTYVFLARITGASELVLGTPVAGRRHADLEQIIGMFVNTLALKAEVEGHETFLDFLRETHTGTLEAFENQDVQFEDLVEKLSIKRDTSRNPLFDVMFLVEKREMKEIEVPGLRLKPQPYKSGTSKFDLTFRGTETEDAIHFTLEYSGKLFKRQTVEGLIGNFQHLVSVVTADPQQKISQFDMLSSQEKRKVLHTFNDTATAFPKDQTIHELFEQQVEQVAGRVALVGSDCASVSGYGQGHVTYRELNRRANLLAGTLRAKGAGADTVVGLMADRSLQLVVGIMAILKAGGAYLPIEIGYPLNRITFMLQDSHSELLLATGKHMGQLDGVIEAIDLEAEGNYRGEGANLKPVNRSHHLAYIIYTSGTTGKPKGNLTQHFNAVRVVRDTNYINITKTDRILQWSNYAFDGSVFDFYGALLNGAGLIMLRQDEGGDVQAVADTISREHITVFFVTTALFNALVDLAIDCFAHVRRVLFGGERVSVAHCQRLLEYLGQNRIVHVYGPTETTVYASYYFIDAIEENQRTVPIGRPLANTSLYILDRNLQAVPIGVSGEIYIGDDGLARGYLNQPELTADRFVNLAAKSREDTRSSKDEILTPKSYILYRTGDLARWLPEGDVEFLGRIDHQVKMRGFRVEPGEIESLLLQHETVKEAVVILRDDPGKGKYLCAYIVASPAVADDAVDVTGIREFLARELPPYMVPSYFAQVPQMPLTANGKVDIRALPEPEIEEGERYLPPTTPLQEKLVKIWSEVLAIPREVIGIEDDFFQLGGHSLKATLLISLIKREFQVKIPLTEVFRLPTVKGLAEYIREAAVDRTVPITLTEDREYYPLSSVQKRMYIVQQTDRSAVAYNMPIARILEGEISKEQLTAIFHRLVARHESFRTSFRIVQGEPVQRVHKHIDFNVQYQRVEDLQYSVEGTLPDQTDSASCPIHYFVQPFDLSHPPLLRVKIVEMEEAKLLLMIDMHHIVSDGSSQGILIRDFISLYRSEELPRLKFRFRDYTQWQHKAQVRETIRQQGQYWEQVFEDRPPALDLPTDFARPGEGTFNGKSRRFQVDRQRTAALKELAEEEDVTLYMLLLAITNVFLHKLSGQEDIVVGAPVAGRSQADLQPIIGMFVNTLALRNFPAGDKGFKAFLWEIRERTLAAFENQEYPFDELVERVAPEREMGRHPLFDVMFLLQNIDIPEVEAAGLRVRPYEFPLSISKFDLTVIGFEAGERLGFIFEYSTQLFTEETIEMFVGNFNEVVAAVMENGETRLNDIKTTHHLISAGADVPQLDLGF
jgi:amino acid adenylation domain-containing protein